MLVIIDNYDSFTYNLYQLVAGEGREVKVFRNDEVTVQDLQKLRPEGVIVSPGPGIPSRAGICISLIQAMARATPILGVCLGLQAMVEAFGGDVVRAPTIVHGKPSVIFHRRQGIFEGLPLPFTAGRYHSLMASRETLPSCLRVEAETTDGVIMALQHATYPCYGVQFHPESQLTPEGSKLMGNFLRKCRRVTC